MDLQTFNSLVTRMQSPENADRSEAEKQYDQIDLPQKVSLLFQLYGEKGAALEVRSMCLILLRRLLANNWEELWPAIGAENQKSVTDQNYILNPVICRSVPNIFGSDQDRYLPGIKVVY
uniref:Importin N-terminal domain-containing protein n=1 Tax=Heterorhabditis bacteriophora TaxID=37862 RepID=A0A1I7X5E2_HETBA